MMEALEEEALMLVLLVEMELLDKEIMVVVHLMVILTHLEVGEEKVLLEETQHQLHKLELEELELILTLLGQLQHQLAIADIMLEAVAVELLVALDILAVVKVELVEMAEAEMVELEALVKLLVKLILVAVEVLVLTMEVPQLLIQQMVVQEL